jgi:RecA/RadA recombinase
MIFPTPRLNQIITSKQKIVSIWGDFGVGKTTFALQTALNSAKNGNKVLYFYSKPNFPTQRLGSLLKVESADLLDEINFLRITSFNELFSVIFNLEFLILNNLKEKGNSLNIIIIDSLTDLYRLELNPDKKEKNVSLNYQLNQILATLNYLNQTYDIEILVVNELSRKSEDEMVIELQSGGKIVDFWIFNSLKIERTDVPNNRKIIVKNISDDKTIEFSSKLTNQGFE